MTQNGTAHRRTAVSNGSKRGSVPNLTPRPARSLGELAFRHREAYHHTEGNLLSSLANGLLHGKSAAWVADFYVSHKQQQPQQNWYNDSMQLVNELRNVLRFEPEGLNKELLSTFIESLLTCIKRVA